MSVRVGDFAGLDEVARVAKSARLGNIPRVPSVFLGSFEATLKDLTAAYTIFPNGGVWMNDSPRPYSPPDDTPPEELITDIYLPLEPR